MALRKLKPIEERDPYAAAVLDAFDALEDSFPADADEPMTVGLDCCPHHVPYGSDCDECDEEDADIAMRLTPKVQIEGLADTLEKGEKA
ncbi:MAG: hypothetical protein K8H84_00110 [Sulfuricella denitrificans]|nr:hypothetical protein [Sulfuricella denitrificans]